MSLIGIDDNNRTVQAFAEPITGQTVVITTGVAQSAKTAAVLTEGWYRLFIPKTMTGILRCASGTFATVAATATDLPRESGEYYIRISAGDTLAVYDAGAGGTVVELTLM